MYLLATLLFITHVFSDAPVTIDQVDIYKKQRQCFSSCFVRFSVAGYDIAGQISCPKEPMVMNDCFCRPDLQQEAHRFVHTCVANACSDNALDISAATSLYDNYCTDNGYIRPVEATTTPISGASKTQSGSRIGTPTPTAGPTGFDSPIDEEKKLSAGELAGIIVGAISAVATVIGVYFGWKSYRNRHERHLIAAPPPVQYWGGQRSYGY